MPRAKVLELATCAFVSRRENVCLVGQTGVGKSHIAQALGHRACVAGHSALYIPAHQMLTELRAARGDGSYDRRLSRFTSPDLLIIDDLGLRTLQGDEPMGLYEIIRQRHERGSIVITTNLAFSGRPQVRRREARDRLIDRRPARGPRRHHHDEEGRASGCSDGVIASRRQLPDL